MAVSGCRLQGSKVRGSRSLSRALSVQVLQGSDGRGSRSPSVVVCVHVLQGPRCGGAGGGGKVTISGCGCACAANRQSGAGLELSQKATFGGNFSKTGWSLYGLSPRTLIAFSTEPIFTLQFPRRNTADRENKILRAENQGLSKSLWVVFLFKRNLTVGYNVA